MIILLEDLADSGYNTTFFSNIIEIIDSFFEFNSGAEISIVICNNDEIKDLNFKYRGIEKPTDVLSFPLYEDLMLGDIVISLEKAREYALENDISESREIAFLFIHGFMHLLGFDHEVGEVEEKEYFDMQESILKEWVSKYENISS